MKWTKVYQTFARKVWSLFLIHSVYDIIYELRDN